MFTLTIPMERPLTITSIQYLKVGNWIELQGIVGNPGKSSVNISDGTNHGGQLKSFTSPGFCCNCGRASTTTEKERS